MSIQFAGAKPGLKIYSEEWADAVSKHPKNVTRVHALRICRAFMGDAKDLDPLYAMLDQYYEHRCHTETEEEVP